MLWSRRTWLGAAAASAAAADGPVRSKPLRPRLFGPLYYDDAELTLVTEVIKSRSPFRFWGMGPTPPDKVEKLEKTVAQWMGVQYALAVNSGTSALETALAALEVGPGDEVIVPAWTWHSCFHAVVRLGALPVLCEVDESFNLDPSAVEACISPATKVLMAVHLQGNPADLSKLLPIARRRNLKVLEDCSQSVGASYQGKPVGSYGDIAAASLQVNKTISAGEGGVVYTNDPKLFERAVRFHDVGTMRAPHQQWIGGQAALQPFPGSNFRMNELTGAVLLAQFRKLTNVVADIRGVAKQVYEGTRGLPGVKYRKLPDPAGELGVGVFFDFGTKERAKRFLEEMKAQNIPCSPPGGSVYIPAQNYAQQKIAYGPKWPSYSLGRGPSMSYAPERFPRTADILARFAGPPLDPKYTAADTRDIVEAVRRVWPRLG